MIEVVTFNDLKTLGDPDGVVVSTVSASKEWGGLSPFLIGPCQMWSNRKSRNMENAWQYTKVYPCHLEDDGSVGAKWMAWATSGWYSQRAHRYPMGKGALPLYSWWNGHRLGYVEARKAIYVPLYQLAVSQTDAWKRLQDASNAASDAGRNLYLLDYDAYRHKGMGMSYLDVANNAVRKMGHAFVLAMMLEDQGALSVLLEEGKKLRGDIQ